MSGYSPANSTVGYMQVVGTQKLYDSSDTNIAKAQPQGQAQTEPNFGSAGSIYTPDNTLPMRQPNVCPGCGRCRDCGHPYTPAPYVPYPYQPYVPQPYPQITWTASGGTQGLSDAYRYVAVNTNAGVNCQPNQMIARH